MNKDNPGVNDFSVGDYFGLPTAKQIKSVNSNGNINYGVNALYGRGYAMTWNEYFRDINLMPAAFCPLDDSDRLFNSRVSDPFKYAYAYGSLLPVSRCMTILQVLCLTLSVERMFLSILAVLLLLKPAALFLILK